MKWATAAAIALFAPSLSFSAVCKRNAHGVYEDPACASEAFSKADKELNAVYRRLLAQVDDAAKIKLRASQRAWIAYRDSNAGFVYAVEGEGSAGRMVLANQNEQATRARIRELKSWFR